MSSIQELDETQLTAARAAAWGQTEEPLVTLEAARAWVNERGLVLFSPHGAQLPVPAPSLVEATLGVAKAAPTSAQRLAGRGLVARMVAEGSALPLNLLGLPGEDPDFVVSAQVFSYVFTMRGDKAWKQAPATTGAVKVSPLGLRVWEVLGERALTAAELANELGREVTEAAILRALTELWSQLRVIPMVQAGELPSLWERVSRRFTKAVKAGANAGQPTALSALASLYLRQVFAASEEEVATFLSPLTARSRVREVLHALLGARQLETIAVEGKTLLHIPGTLPQLAVVEAEAVEGEDGVVAEAPAPKPKKVGTGRITSFTKTRTEAGEFRGKPVRTFAKGGAKPTARFGARADGKSEGERRPFKKAGAARPAGKPSFSKPWEEDRKPRAAAAAAAKSAGPDSFSKYKRPAKEDREPLGPREQAGLPEAKRTAPKASFDRAAPRTFDRKPAFGAKPYAAKKAFGEKPAFGAKRPYVKRGEEDGEKPAFKPRAYEGQGKTFEKKPYAGKPAFGAKPFGAKKSFGDKPSFGAKKAFGDKPAYGAKKAFDEKPAFGAKRPYVKRTEEDGERPAFKPRAFSAAGAAAKPFAKPASKGAYERKTFGDKPYAAKPAFAKRPYAKRVASSEPFEPGNVERTIAKRPHKPRAADADNRPFTKAPWTPEESGTEKRAFKPRSGAGPRKFGAKPGGFKRK